MNVFEPIEHLDVVAAAALERHAIDGAGKRDRHAVAARGRRVRILRRVRTVLVGDAADRFVDLGVGDFGGHTVERDVLERRKFDLRKDFHLDRVVEVGRAIDDGLDRGLLGRQLDLWLHREPQVVVLHNLGVGVAHRRLDGLGHHGLAVHALEVPRRHLAGTETVDAHLTLHFVEARVDLRVEIARRDHHAIRALEAVRQCFRYLHGNRSRSLWHERRCQNFVPQS